MTKKFVNKSSERPEKETEYSEANYNKYLRKKNRLKLKVDKQVDDFNKKWNN